MRRSTWSSFTHDSNVLSLNAAVIRCLRVLMRAVHAQKKTVNTWAPWATTICNGYHWSRMFCGREWRIDAMSQTNTTQDSNSYSELQITVVIVVVVLGLVAISQVGVIVWLLRRRERASRTKNTTSLEEGVAETKEIVHTPTIRYEDTEKNHEPDTSSTPPLPLPPFNSSMVPGWKHPIAKEESSFAIADLFNELERKQNREPSDKIPTPDTDSDSTTTLTQSGVVCDDDLLFDDPCSTVSSMRSSYYEVHIKDQYGIDLSDSGLIQDTHSSVDTDISSPEVKPPVLMSRTEDLATVIEEPLKGRTFSKSSAPIIVKSESPIEHDRAVQLSLQYGIALGHSRPPSQRLRDSVTCYKYGPTSTDVPRTYRFSRLPEELRKSTLPRQFRTRVNSLGSPNRTGSTTGALDDYYDASVNVAVTQKFVHANGPPRSQSKRQKHSKYGQMLSIISNYTQSDATSTA